MFNNVRDIKIVFVRESEQESNLPCVQLAVFLISSMTHDSLSKVFCINPGVLKKFALCAKNKNEIRRQHY